MARIPDRIEDEVSTTDDTADSEASSDTETVDTADTDTSSNDVRTSSIGQVPERYQDDATSDSSDSVSDSSGSTSGSSSADDSDSMQSSSTSSSPPDDAFQSPSGETGSGDTGTDSGSTPSTGSETSEGTESADGSTQQSTPDDAFQSPTGEQAGGSSTTGDASTSDTEGTSSEDSGSVDSGTSSSGDTEVAEQPSTPDDAFRSPSGEEAGSDSVDAGREQGDTSGSTEVGSVGPGANPSAPDSNTDLTRREYQAITQVANQSEDYDSTDLTIVETNEGRVVRPTEEAMAREAAEELEYRLNTTRSGRVGEQVQDSGGTAEQAEQASRAVERAGQGTAAEQSLDVDLDKSDVRVTEATAPVSSFDPGDEMLTEKEARERAEQAKKAFEARGKANQKIPNIFTDDSGRVTTTGYTLGSDVDRIAGDPDEPGSGVIPNNPNDPYRTRPGETAETNVPGQRDPEWVRDLERAAVEADQILRDDLLSGRGDLTEEEMERDYDDDGVPDWAEAGDFNNAFDPRGRSQVELGDIPTRSERQYVDRPGQPGAPDSQGSSGATSGSQTRNVFGISLTTEGRQEIQSAQAEYISQQTGISLTSDDITREGGLTESGEQARNVEMRERNAEVIREINKSQTKRRRATETALYEAREGAQVDTALAVDESVGRALRQEHLNQQRQQDMRQSRVEREIEAGLEEQTGAELDREDIVIEETADGYSGSLSERGEQEVAGQNAPGSALPFVGDALSGVAETTVKIDQYGNDAVETVTPDMNLPSVPNVPLPSREQAAGAAAAGVFAPEPVTSGSGAVVLGGLAVAGVAASTVRETGTFQGPPTASATTTESELEISEEAFSSEITVPSTAVGEQSELQAGGDAVSETEVNVPERALFESELDVSDGLTTTELPLSETGETGEGGSGIDTGGETVVPGDYPLPGRDVPPDPAKDYARRESPESVLGTSPLVQEGIQRQEQPEERETITGDDIAVDQPEIDQPAPSVRERQRREDLDPFERTFPTGSGAVVGDQSNQVTEEAQKQLEEAQKPFVGETGSTGEIGELFPPTASERMQEAQVPEVRSNTTADSLESTVQDQYQAMTPITDTFQVPGLEQPQVQQQGQMTESVFETPTANPTAPNYGTSPGNPYADGFGYNYGYVTTPAVNPPTRLQFSFGDGGDDNADEQFSQNDALFDSRIASAEELAEMEDMEFANSGFDEENQLGF